MREVDVSCFELVVKTKVFRRRLKTERAKDGRKCPISIDSRLRMCYREADYVGQGLSDSRSISFPSFLSLASFSFWYKRNEIIENQEEPIQKWNE